MPMSALAAPTKEHAGESFSANKVAKAIQHARSALREVISVSDSEDEDEQPVVSTKRKRSDHTVPIPRRRQKMTAAPTALVAPVAAPRAGGAVKEEKVKTETLSPTAVNIGVLAAASVAPDNNRRHNPARERRAPEPSKSEVLDPSDYDEEEWEARENNDSIPCESDTSDSEDDGDTDSDRDWTPATAHERHSWQDEPEEEAPTDQERTPGY